MDSIAILWLDDEIELLIPYVISLENLGFDLDTAENAEQAIHKCEHKQYDIIIVDLFLPPSNGVNFLASVRRLQDHAQYVVFSGYLYLDEYRHRIKRLGIKINMLDKNLSVGPSSASFGNNFVKPIMRLVKHKPEKQTGIARIISAIEIRPGWCGVSVNIKKMLGLK